jgi:hypothetical protein
MYGVNDDGELFVTLRCCMLGSTVVAAVVTASKRQHQPRGLAQCVLLHCISKPQHLPGMGFV